MALDATPRRLVLRAEGLPERHGRCGRARHRSRQIGAGEGSGRLRAQAGREAPRTSSIETTAKGEYYSFLRKVPGRAVKDILAEALPGVILGIYFPKTMYWTAKNGPRFIRPIRWMVALLGDEIVPFEIAGVRSGALTSGHRRLGAREIVVTTADYAERLRDHHVILSAAERREKIRSELAGVRVKPDAALLETLVYLTEYPAAIRGSFDPGFPDTARRSAHHGDAPPSEILLGGGRGGQSGAGIRGRHEHSHRSARAS